MNTRLIDTSDLAKCESALRIATEYGQWDTTITGEIRGMVGKELAAIVLATASLQTKAVAKLGAGLWWATERSLQQATPSAVAQLKASWLTGGPVLDFCCGIGADSFAIAHCSSDVTSVDRDDSMVTMASENLRLNRQPHAASVNWLTQDVAGIEIPTDAILHIDPDRREGESRSTRPENYSPDWDTTLRLIQSAAGGIAKLAPAAEFDAPPASHRMWISLSGSVREQSLLTGSVVDSAGKAMGVNLVPGGRSAVVLRALAAPFVFSPDSIKSRCQETNQPEEFMVDPDAAIRAAGLTETFADQYQLKTLGAASGFLTGKAPVSQQAAICERVTWSGACDDRKLRKTLRQMDCFPKRVKTRGVSQNPNVLEKRYRECGETPVTLWIGKAGKRQFAATTEPIAERT